MAACLLHRGLELLQVFIQMSEGVFLDAFGVIAELAAVGQGGETAAVGGHEGIGESDQGGLKWCVVQRLSGGALKVVMLVACIVAHTAILRTAPIQASPSPKRERGNMVPRSRFGLGHKHVRLFTDCTGS